MFPKLISLALVIKLIYGYEGLEFTEALSVGEANQACLNEFGTALASIHSAEDQAAVRAACLQVNPTGIPSVCWIGGYRSGSCTSVADATWSWLDGSPWDYEAWASNQGCADNQPYIFIPRTDSLEDGFYDTTIDQTIPYAVCNSPNCGEGCEGCSDEASCGSDESCSWISNLADCFSNCNDENGGTADNCDLCADATNCEMDPFCYWDPTEGQSGACISGGLRYIACDESTQSSDDSSSGDSAFAVHRRHDSMGSNVEEEEVKYFTLRLGDSAWLNVFIMFGLCMIANICLYMVCFGKPKINN